MVQAGRKVPGTVEKKSWGDLSRVCCSSTDITAKLFEHVHHYSTACYHHFCSSSWWLSCLQGWRVGGHLHLSWCFVCHCILSNWDSVLPCTEAEKMPKLWGSFWLRDERGCAYGSYNC
ncbi:PREDICTED: uncharacterized protein LOC103913554 [Pygoscelis adeliae]|uniref:uncharacterized protein LOC103913554 n=1 Tax=Pygoscelis adeliae TaxID=9238 RepID=UPI0004F4DCBD|nr:PREDICTED: uncharacterized protein LOC103913554 [Pygoscelis adeliae]